MPPSIGYSLPADPVEFSVEDAMLNTWVEDTSVYLRLDSSDVAPSDEHPPDQA
ncbi:MAG: hypothetical protein ACRD26_02750 [Vicinamibacterales bacterium]